MATHERDADVLVAGAGPVGLTSALRLASRGVKVRILDRHWRTGVHSYALALHPESLRQIDAMGALDGLLEQGRRVKTIRFHEGAQPRCDVSLSALGGKYPFTLVLPQSHLEGMLENLLHDRKVDVMWNHRLQDLKQSPLRAEIAKLEQVASGYPISRMEWAVVKTMELSSAYVIGADGCRSLVRDKIGIGLLQHTPPASFSVFEFDAPKELSDEAHVVLDEDGTSVMWPMTDGRCRWSFQVADPDRHEATLERLNGLLSRRAPWFPAATSRIHWSSAVTFAGQLADRFGQGAVWLAGDAAHMAGPAGVQSMNAGLLEGIDLADRLADVLAGTAAVDSLPDYGARQMRRWRALLNLDLQVDASGATDPWVAREARRILPCLPATGDDLAMLLGQLGVKFTPGS